MNTKRLTLPGSYASSIVDDILATANRLGLKKDDLIQEAECVEEYGEYLHMALMGFGPEELRKAAEEVAA